MTCRMSRLRHGPLPPAGPVALTFEAGLLLCRHLAAYAVFVLWPIVQTFRYSFYNWDGVTRPQWAGLQNFKTVFTDQQLVGVIGHAFELILFFSGIPVVLGLAIATVMRRFVTGRMGAVAQDGAVPAPGRPARRRRHRLELDVVDHRVRWTKSSPTSVWAIWAQAWLGDFNTALPAVGVIGAWVLLGLCTVLLLVGMTKIDPVAVRGGPVGRGWAIP